MAAKKINLLTDRNDNTWQIHVKVIKQRRNNNFRIKVDLLSVNCWYIIVNVNRTNLNLGYEYAILKYSEVCLRRNSTENDNAIKTSVLVHPLYRNSWRTIKNAHFCLNQANGGQELYFGIEEFMRFYKMKDLMILLKKKHQPEN
jgi:hypothetical protein